MSWFKRARPILLAGSWTALALLVSACSSFAPVYGDNGPLAGQASLDIAYPKPSGRLEQIIYQDLALRLGSSGSPTATLASVTVSSSATAIGLSATGTPNKTQRVTVTAVLTLVKRDGSSDRPVSVTRRASAEYTASGQVLADVTAAEEASERAARSAAESLRLAILASLSRG